MLHVRRDWMVSKVAPIWPPSRLSCFSISCPALPSLVRQKVSSWVWSHFACEFAGRSRERVWEASQLSSCPCIASESNQLWPLREVGQWARWNFDRTPTSGLLLWELPSVLPSVWYEVNAMIGSALSTLPSVDICRCFWTEPVNWLSDGVGSRLKMSHLDHG